MRHNLLRHVALHRLVNNVLFSNSKSTNQDDNDVAARIDGNHQNKKIGCATIHRSEDNTRHDKKEKKTMMTSEQLCKDKQVQYMAKDNVQPHDCSQIPVHTIKEYPHQMHSFLEPIPLSLPHSECGAVYTDVTYEHHLCKSSDVNKANTCNIDYEKSGAMQNNLQKKDNNIIDCINDCNSKSCIQPSSHIIFHKVRCIDVAVQTDGPDKQIKDTNTTCDDSPNNSSRCDASQNYNTKREASTSTDDLCQCNAVVNAKHLRKKEITRYKNRTCRNEWADKEEYSRKEEEELEESEQTWTESEDEDDTTSDDELVWHMHRQQQQEEQNHRKHYRSSNNDELFNKKEHQYQEEEEKLEKCKLGVEHYKRANDKARCSCAICHPHVMSSCHSMQRKKEEEEQEEEEQEKYNELACDAKTHQESQAEFEALSLDELQCLGTSLLKEYNELMSCAKVNEAELALIEKRWHQYYCQLLHQQQHHCFNKTEVQNKHEQTHKLSKNANVSRCSLHKKHRCTNKLLYCNNNKNNYHRNYRLYCKSNINNNHECIDCPSHNVCSLNVQRRYVELLQERVKREILRCKLTVFTQVLRRRIDALEILSLESP